MKKSILNIGKALNKAEQKIINGGLNAKRPCVIVYDDLGHCSAGPQCPIPSECQL